MLSSTNLKQKQGKGVISNNPLEVRRSHLTRPKLNSFEKQRRVLCLQTDWTNLEYSYNLAHNGGSSLYC